VKRLTIAAAVRMTAAELIAHLIASGLSQREIAKAIGSNSPTISRIATGQRTTSEAVYRDLLALSTSPKKLSKKSPG
jgi:transcriptional regulator with XRE-family HTH domain